MTRAALAPVVELARMHLAGLEPRWSHVQAVGQTAERVCREYGFVDELAVAAWSHDLGYAPDLVVTGFHPLDGAQYLSRIGASEVVVALVAHHSGASFEAEERGLQGRLAELPEPPADLMDVLTFIDMTTGPTGDAVTIDARLQEILGRYRASDPVHRAVTRAGPSLRAAAARAALRLGLPAVGPASFL